MTVVFSPAYSEWKVTDAFFMSLHALWYMSGEIIGMSVGSSIISTHAVDREKDGFDFHGCIAGCEH